MTIARLIDLAIAAALAVMAIAVLVLMVAAFLATGGDPRIGWALLLMAVCTLLAYLRVVEGVRP